MTISNRCAWDILQCAHHSGEHWGPSLGTFDYFIDNPGPGARAQNAGPLSFDVRLASGLKVSDFAANSSGCFFVADIMNAAGATGLSGIDTSDVPVPEPVSWLFGAGVLSFVVLRRHSTAGAK